MTALELIGIRRSVRTYNGSPLTQRQLDSIRALTEGTDNPYGIPVRWHILNAKEKGLSSPVIVGEDTYLTGVIDRVPHAEEAFGYSFEKLLLRCVEAGFGTVWIAGTMNRKAFESAVNLTQGQTMPCVSPVGCPAEKMSARELLMRKGVGADRRLSYSSLFFQQSFRTPVTEPLDSELKQLLDAVRLAPSAVNKQPWRVVVCGDSFHFYLKHNKGYLDSSGWDLQKIDLGIALYHLAMVLEEKKGFDFLLDDPQLSAPADTDYIATLRSKA